MLLIGEEQDIRKREAAIAANAKDTEEKNNFIFNTHTPVALWCLKNKKA